jgi:hypothetical protein
MSKKEKTDIEILKEELKEKEEEIIELKKELHYIKKDYTSAVLLLISMVVIIILSIIIIYGLINNHLSALKVYKRDKLIKETKLQNKDLDFYKLFYESQMKQVKDQPKKFTCEPMCGFYGKCIDGNTCICEDGWSGNRCKIPINVYPAEVYSSLNLTLTCKLSLDNDGTTLNGFCIDFLHDGLIKKSSLDLFDKDYKFVCGREFFVNSPILKINMIGGCKLCVNTIYWTEYKACVDLNNCIKNDNGVLTWK